MTKAKEQEQLWDGAGYLERKKARQEKITPEWKTNPETGERFFIRRLGLMPSYVARNMAALLKEESLASWVDQGLDLPEANGDSESENEARSEIATSQQQSQRISQLTGKVVVAACVVPKIVLGPARRPGELDIADLDDSDLAFIYRCGLGLEAESPVELKGGEEVPVRELKRVSGKPGKRSGTIARG